jgi:choline dehydrogenase-like flavoprotein
MVEFQAAAPVTIRTYFPTGSQTGGSAAHHCAAWFRLDEGDFHMKSTFGRGNHWTIADAEAAAILRY